MKFSRLFAAFVFMTSLGLSTMASAQVQATPIPLPSPGPKHRPDMVTEGNLWVVTGYRDAFRHGPYPVRHSLCYFYLGNRGTHDLYAWVSTSFRGWWGFAEKEGDQVVQFGNFAPVLNPARSLHRPLNWRGHSSMQFELVSRQKGRFVPQDLATGHAQAYIEPGFARAFANMKLVRRGKCLPHIAQQIKGVMETGGGIGADGSVQVTDALVETLKTAADLAPERQKNNGSSEDFPFSTELAPIDLLLGQ